MINKLDTKLDVCEETWNRCRLSLFAYAYEMGETPLIDDAGFDDLASRINVDVETNCKVHDKFFKREFHPDTGMWIYKHPNLDGVKKIYEMVLKNQKGIKKPEKVSHGLF